MFNMFPLAHWFLICPVEFAKLAGAPSAECLGNPPDVEQTARAVLG